MSSILQSLRDLVSSLVEAIFSVFKTAFEAVYTLAHTIIGFFASFVDMIVHAVKGTLEAVGAVGGFVAGNIIVIAIIAAGYYVYSKNRGAEGRALMTGDIKKRS